MSAWVIGYVAVNVVLSDAPGARLAGRSGRFHGEDAGGCERHQRALHLGRGVRPGLWARGGGTLRFRAFTATGELYDAFDLEKEEGRPNRMVDRSPNLS